jgi:hypothetical protein
MALAVAKYGFHLSVLPGAHRRPMQLPHARGGTTASFA